MHPGCVQRQREPGVNMLGCFMKNLMWLLVDITNLLSLLRPSLFLPDRTKELLLAIVWVVEQRVMDT